MTFLKKLGEILVKGTAVLTGLMPLFPQYSKEAGRAKDVLEEAIGIIVIVEATGQAFNIPGPDKLKAAAPLIAQLILRTDAFAGKKIDNKVLFTSGATKIADGLVECLNSINENEVKSDNL